jgi:hypothetical protein
MAILVMLPRLVVGVDYSNPESGVEPAVPSSRADIVLVSWAAENGKDRIYVLMTEKTYRAMIGKPDDARPWSGPDEFPKFGLLLNVPGLEAAISRIPSGSVITWRDAPIARSSRPSEAVVEEIRTFAHARGIELRIFHE